MLQYLNYVVAGILLVLSGLFAERRRTPTSDDGMITREHVA